MDLSVMTSCAATGSDASRMARAMSSFRTRFRMARGG